MLEIERGHAATLETKDTVLPQPPDPSFSRYVYNHFIPLHDGHAGNDWKGTTSPRIKLKQLAANRQKSLVPGTRETWPTSGNTPLPLVPEPNSIKVNNFDVAGYGIYVDPKWPKRTLSRKMTVSIPKENSPSKLPALGDSSSSARRSHKKSRHVRSASEAQLSTILKSTSERLKTANQKSRPRATLLDQVPGAPPSQPLPEAPLEKPSESCELPIESDHGDSVTRSIYELLKNPEFSPVKSGRRKPPHDSARLDRSPTPSEDSLRVSIIPPTALSSPSKSKPKNRYSQGSIIPFAETRELAELVNRKNKAPEWEVKVQSDQKRPASMSATYQISLLNDPFFSEVNSSKPFIPRDESLGPRPLYIRKSNLSGDKLPRRPQSCMAPHEHTSGNVQKSPNPLPPTQDSNPFRWSTQETMQYRSTTSPTQKRISKRSKVIRPPKLPQSVSIDMFLEERDVGKPSGAVRPSTSKLPVAGTKLDSRPPSVATFSPTLTNIKRKPNDSSPTPGQEIPRICIPVFGEKNFTPNPEEQLFARGIHQTSPKRKQHIVNMACDNLLPSVQDQGQLVSFPPPNIPPIRPQSTRNSLPHISTIYSPPPNSIFMQHSQAQYLASPLPPLLTIPGHLTGPRPEPSKPNPTSAFGRSIFSSPKAVKSSVAMLKRMDSGITLSTFTLQPQMDVNSQAVRAEAEEKRGRDTSSFLLSNSQKPGPMSISRPRQGSIVIDERSGSQRERKKLRSRDMNEDMDFFLRKRGLSSPSYKEGKKLSLVKEVDTFKPQAEKKGFGGEATDFSILASEKPQADMGMALMMGVETTSNSGINFQFVAVDPATFSVSSSDSETEYEPTTTSSTKISHVPPPPKSSARRKSPQEINTAPKEEQDTLAQYAHSPAHTPPPPPFKFVQTNLTSTTPFSSKALPSPTSPPLNFAHPKSQLKTQPSTIIPSAPPPHWSSIPSTKPSTYTSSIKSSHSLKRARIPTPKTTPSIVPPARSHKRDSAKFNGGTGARGRVRSLAIGGDEKGGGIEEAKGKGKVPEWVWSVDGLGLVLGWVGGGGRISGEGRGVNGNGREEWDTGCGKERESMYGDGGMGGMSVGNGNGGFF